MRFSPDGKRLAAAGGTDYAARDAGWDWDHRAFVWSLDRTPMQDPLLFSLGAFSSGNLPKPNIRYKQPKLSQEEENDLFKKPQKGKKEKTGNKKGNKTASKRERKKKQLNEKEKEVQHEETDALGVVLDTKTKEDIFKSITVSCVAWSWDSKYIATGNEGNI